jgi:pantoate--beta-alanine ligase
MFAVKSVGELKKILHPLREGGSVGFVPTMGALHKGHITLVEKAVLENKTVVVSIFVNPTQFNDPKDLERYPRTLDSDLILLEPAGCNVVFIPDVKEVYPQPDTRQFNFGLAGQVMEGKHRPGHFNGVAQVVSKLFDMVEPDKAYFGLKDYQQLAIIKLMVSQLKLNVEIVPCPIVREKNGLAMSSRNELLTPAERENAALISEVLFEAGKLAGKFPVEELKEWVTAKIDENPYLKTEYFEISDAHSLTPLESWETPGEKVACIAVFCGKVRLIDNIQL